MFWHWSVISTRTKNPFWLYFCLEGTAKLFFTTRPIRWIISKTSPFPHQNQPFAKMIYTWQNSMQSCTVACKKMFRPTSSVCILWRQLSVSLVYSLADGNEKLWTAKLCEHVYMLESVCSEQTAIRQELRPSTSNPRHHLHRPFPACRVIPAPALPPLPSHTYQPPAAVPLPESGSRTLDTLDKQQQLIHLTLCLSLSLYNSVYLF